MVVYGVALLSFCMLVGVFLGDLLGQLIGVQANVGGIGIALLSTAIVTPGHCSFNWVRYCDRERSLLRLIWANQKCSAANILNRPIITIAFCRAGPSADGTPAAK